MNGARQTRVYALGAAAVLLLIFMSLRWWTASAIGVEGTKSASAWGSMEVIRVLLLVLALSAGGLAYAAKRGPGGRGVPVRDLAHDIAAGGVLGAVLIAFRLAVPPQFADVQTTFGGMAVGPDASAHITYSADSAGVLALLACLAIAGLAVTLARDEPGGFQLSYLMRRRGSGRWWEGLRSRRNIG